jgi:hypothetical protein
MTTVSISRGRSVALADVWLGCCSEDPKGTSDNTSASSNSITSSMSSASWMFSLAILRASGSISTPRTVLGWIQRCPVAKEKKAEDTLHPGTQKQCPE